MVRQNFTKLGSLHELKRAVDGQAGPGGSEFTDYMSSYTSAAVRTVVIGKRWNQETEFFPRDKITSFSSLFAEINFSTQFGNLDLAAALNALQFKDLSAELNIIQIADLRANLNPFNTVDLSAILNTVYKGDLSANLNPFTTADLRASLNPFNTADLSASIGPFTKADLGANLSPFTTTDLSANLNPFNTVDLSAALNVIYKKDLGANLNPFTTADLSAILNTVPSEDLIALINSIPPFDLGGNVNSVPYVNLGAIGGGHFPSHLTASLKITPPINFPAFLRIATLGTEDLGASLNQVGAYTHITANLDVWFRQSRNLGAKIIIRTPKDLQAFVHGYKIEDLGAYLLTQRVKDMTGIVKGWVRGVEKNMQAFLRKTAAGTIDMGVDPLKPIISTHTSDKVPNLDKVTKYFHENKYIFGTKAKGFFVLSIEPIFGYFPDLHAEIFARQYFREHLAGFIRAAIPATRDLPTVANAVNAYVVVNKVVLSPQPLSDVSAFLNQIGAIKALGAVIRIRFTTSTGTSDDAHFSTTTASYKFILGTNKGIYIPTSRVASIRAEFFKNSHPRPDLRAVVHGWHENNFAAYIKEYTFKTLPAQLTVVGTDQYKDLLAGLTPAHVLELLGNIASTGTFEHILAEITPSGVSINLGAFISSFINPLSFNSVAVSTKPFRDMFAVINYGSLVSCAMKSQSENMPGFIRSLFASDDVEGSNLGAFLNALHLVVSMPADITGRKKTRLRTVTLNFRAAVRDSVSMQSFLVPSRSETSDLLADIYGLSHETNIGASLTPVRYNITGVQFTPYENVVNLATDLIKKVFVSFRTAVSSYVYEEISNAVYPTDQGKWAIDLRTITQRDGLFNRDPDDRDLEISSIVEYFSVDEAIRQALVILCERRKESIGASITAIGKTSNFPASVFAFGSNRFTDMRSIIFPVKTPPEIGAEINTGNFDSGIKGLPTSIKVLYSTAYPLTGTIIGDVVTDLGAEVIPV